VQANKAKDMEACAEEGRYEFLLVVARLKMKGGVGSPVNPIAIF